MPRRTRPVSHLCFAASWWRTEWPQVCSHRITYTQGRRRGWQRPVWLAMAIVYPALSSVLGVLLALTAHASTPTVVAAGILSAVLGLAVLLVGAVLTTALCLRRAAVTCWFDDAEGRAGAVAVPHGDAAWKVHYVHAHPTGHGLGHKVMAQLTDAADARGMDLLLDASHPDTVRFYARHNFVPDTPGAMRMTRRAEERPRTTRNV